VPLDVIVVRKLGYPSPPLLAIEAIGEDGGELSMWRAWIGWRLAAPTLRLWRTWSAPRRNAGVLAVPVAPEAAAATLRDVCDESLGDDQDCVVFPRRPIVRRLHPESDDEVMDLLRENTHV